MMHVYKEVPLEMKFDLCRAVAVLSIVFSTALDDLPLIVAFLFTLILGIEVTSTKAFLMCVVCTCMYDIGGWMFYLF